MADDDTPFRDAESWLAAQGIDREPIRVRPDPPAGDAGAPPTGSPPGQPTPDAPGAGAPAADEREPAAQPRLEDEVAKAIAYARRATAQAPRSEARLRRAFEERYPDPVVDLAMGRARSEGIVDDRSYAAALADEGRAKGHAPLRIKQTLHKRDIDPEVIEEVLAGLDDPDPEAAAFEVARDRAQRLRGVDAETAYRRLVGYLARRGYPEALSRKAARVTVFNDREDQRTAER